jgi:prephenate dehydrogenase
LTRDFHTTPEAVEKITSFWKELGSHTVEIPPEDHDTILAYLSHSPHILSSLMVNWADNLDLIQKYNKHSPLPLSGGGFRDMSRIAGSNPEMWEAIIATNKNAICQSLKQFNKDLEVLIDKLENPEFTVGFWKQYFQNSKKARDRILKIEHS